MNPLQYKPYVLLKLSGSIQTVCIVGICSTHYFKYLEWKMVKGTVHIYKYNDYKTIYVLYYDIKTITCEYLALFCEDVVALKRAVGGTCMTDTCISCGLEFFL